MLLHRTTRGERAAADDDTDTCNAESTLRQKRFLVCFSAHLSSHRRAAICCNRLSFWKTKVFCKDQSQKIRSWRWLSKNIPTTLQTKDSKGSWRNERQLTDGRLFFTKSRLQDEDVEQADKKEKRDWWYFSESSLWFNLYWTELEWNKIMLAMSTWCSKGLCSFLKRLCVERAIEF